MTTTQMEFFLEAARCQNFTIAAEHLYVSQPALSKQINSIERQLNTKLFVRENNSVSLTPEGKILYQELQEIYQAYTVMLAKIEQVRSGISGSLDIAVMEDQQINDVMIAAVQNFMTRYPNTRIGLRHMELHKIHHRLLNGEIDFALELQHFENHMPQFSFLELENDPEMLAVPSSLDLAAIGVKGPEDYNRITEILPCIMLRTDSFESPVRQTLEELSINRHSSTFANKQVRYVSSIGAIPLMVVAGLGVTIANSTYILRYEPSVRLLPGYPDRKISKGLYWKTDTVNPLVPAFLEILRDGIS